MVVPIHTTSALNKTTTTIGPWISPFMQNANYSVFMTTVSNGQIISVVVIASVINAFSAEKVKSISRNGSSSSMDKYVNYSNPLI